MMAAAEADQRVAGAAVLFAARPEAIGIVAVGRGEHVRQPVGGGRRDHGQPAGRRQQVADREVLGDAAHEHHQRRVHALGFLDGALQHDEPPEMLQRDLVAPRQLGLELLDELRGAGRGDEQALLDLGRRL